MLNMFLVLVLVRRVFEPSADFFQCLFNFVSATLWTFTVKRACAVCSFNSYYFTLPCCNQLVSRHVKDTGMSVRVRYLCRKWLFDKCKEEIASEFENVTVPHRRTILRTVNRLSQRRSLLNNMYIETQSAPWRESWWNRWKAWTFSSGSL
jgi:hypothetical protein